MYVASGLILLLAATGAYGLGGLSASCYYDEDCEGTTTFCRDRSQCSCKNNFRQEGTSCRATVGASCRDSNDCSTLDNSECKETEKICDCRSGYVTHETKFSCLAEVSVHRGSCETTPQCRPLGPFAVCPNQQCVCQASYHHANQYCLKNKGLREACSNDTECYLSDNEAYKIRCSDKTNGRCVCADGYYESDNTCKDSSSHLAVSMATVVLCLAARLALCL